MKWPPEKGEAALRHAATPKLTIRAQNNCCVAIAQHLCDPRPLVCSAQDECEHSDTFIQLLVPGSVHFGKEICRNCDRVLRWIPKPATLPRQRFNALRLVKLTMHSGLSPWERAFIRDVAQLRKLSPKQQALLDRLCRQYLGAKTQ